MWIRISYKEYIDEDKPFFRWDFLKAILIRNPYSLTYFLKRLIIHIDKILLMNKTSSFYNYAVWISEFSTIILQRVWTLIMIAAENSEKKSAGECQFWLIGSRHQRWTGIVPVLSWTLNYKRWKQCVVQFWLIVNKWLR